MPTSEPFSLPLPRPFWSGLGWGLVVTGGIITFGTVENSLTTAGGHAFAGEHPNVVLYVLVAGMTNFLLGWLSVAAGRRFAQPRRAFVIWIVAFVLSWVVAFVVSAAIRATFAALGLMPQPIDFTLIQVLMFATIGVGALTAIYCHQKRGVRPRSSRSGGDNA